MKDLVIIGAGGFGREVADTVKRINDENSKYNLIGFIDDDESVVGNEINGIEVLGNTEFLKRKINNDVRAAIAIASSDIKKYVASLLKGYVVWENIIDPTVIISESNIMGVGNIIQPFVVINANSKIGNHCTINYGCGLGHDVILDDYVSLMPMCNVTGNVHLNESVYLGADVCIIPSVNIEKESIVGAGTTVIKDIVETGTYVGNPARRVK
ncbi:MAG: acetyltransferase [Anaerovoracaceae bacterium]